MVKSGLIIGAVSFILILGITTVITPLCAPCLGILLGLVAGYLAGVFDKPLDSSESIRKGAIAGAIAGAIGFVGGLVGAVINGALMNPANVASIMRAFGFTTFSIGQAEIWATQLGIGFCIGIFNILWMAVLGLAGCAVWYQISGKNQSGAKLPPQQPESPIA